MKTARQRSCLRRVPPFSLLISLLIALTACSFPGIASTTAQLPVVSTTPQATALPPLRLPQDEAPHQELTEWWYYTGHLQAATADGQVRHYGFELVFFQVLRSDLPPVYAAHFAISDITRGQFHFDQRRILVPRSEGGGPGFHLQVADWSMQGLNGHDQLQAALANYALRLNLQAVKPAVLHNGDGLITYGLAGFSYYYSRTRMLASGVMIDHGTTLQVKGLAWMDHQWGNFLTLAGGGWDWFSIQLNDTTEIMLYLIRDASDRVIATYAGFIPAQGGEQLLPAKALKITVLGSWLSPTTGARYPAGWRITLADSQRAIALTLLPELADQELVTYQSTGNAYWEGAVSVRGESNGRAVTGEGYVELTGYARSFNLES
jgi:predicted secreted hydrolase